MGIDVEENAVPVTEGVRSGCSFLGLAPLYLANEGKLSCILPQAKVEAVLEVFKSDPKAAGAVRVGTATEANPGKVIPVTPFGGRCMLNMLEGEQLPRIC